MLPNAGPMKISQLPTETEAKLLIVSVTPHEIVDVIRNLPFVGEFPLGKEINQSFEDLYFDFPDQALSRKKWAMRVRRYSDAEKVAMKGPASELSDGALKRPELEMPWDMDCPEQILQMLESLGVGHKESTLRDTDAERFLISIGFEMIQRRTTHRITRNIIDPTNSLAVAELAMDRVNFTVGEATLVHYEIEVESWASLDCPVIEKSLRFLTELLGSSVIPWRLDKLTTVKIVSDLFEFGKLRPHCSKGLLSYPAYEMVYRESQRRELSVKHSY